MSTDFRPVPDIPFDSLFDGRLEKHGVKEKVSSNSTAEIRCLVGNDGVLQAYRDPRGNSGFCLYGFQPVPWIIFDALTREFETELVSEHDHRFWGFATKEHEIEWHERMNRDGEDQFYKDLVQHVRGEPNGLKAGTVGLEQAEIASALVASDESWLALENRQQLLEAVEVIYDRHHTITITMTPEHMAAVELMVARRNKLPQG